MAVLSVLRPIRFDGERRQALAITGPDGNAAAIDEAGRAENGPVLAYGVVAPAMAASLVARGWVDLGRAPRLARPLRVGKIPLVLPRSRRPGVREITVADPRLTRLWDRFSIDVPVAIERNAAHVNPRIFPENAPPRARVLVFEDGDRYVIRALCMFQKDGTVRELLHDRSLAGMRAASHLLGLALREMIAAGATSATALSLPHSGSYPLLARHLFTSLAASGDDRVVVLARDADLADIVTSLGHWYLSGLDLGDD